MTREQQLGEDLYWMQERAHDLVNGGQNIPQSLIYDMEDAEWILRKQRSCNDQED